MNEVLEGTVLTPDQVEVGQVVKIRELYVDDDFADAQTIFVSSETVYVGVVSDTVRVRPGDEQTIGLNGRPYYLSTRTTGGEMKYTIELLEDVAPEPPRSPGYYLTSGDGWATSVRYFDGQGWAWTDGDPDYLWTDEELTVLSPRIEIPTTTTEAL